MQREVFKWLKFLGFSISSKYLYDQLTSHPAYPSLLSLTDTLDQFGIANGVIEIDRNNLPELPYPLLAHLKNKDLEEIVLVKSKNMLLRPRVFETWDGVVVVAEQKDSFNDSEENVKNLKIEQHGKQVRQITISLLSILILLSASVTFSLTALALLVTTLMGLVLSFSIVLKSMGITNQVTRTLCDAEAADCTHVINSRPLKLPFDVSIADISFAYFGGSLVYQCVWIPNSPVTSGFDSLFLFSLLTIPITIFSLLYQAIVLRKYCRVCLAITIILWVQFILLLPGFSINSIRKLDVIVTMIFVGIALFSWILAKQRHHSRTLLREEVTRLSRFKRDSSIFAWRLEKAKEIDTTLFASEIYLGNPQSNLDFLIVCNPYCGACGYAHTLLTQILNVHRDNVRMRVRFAVNTNQESDNLTATKYLMQLLIDKDSSPRRNETILHDWFIASDLDIFSKKYPLGSSKDISQDLAEHERWTKSAAVLFTPSFYINSHEFPSGYYLEELKYMVTDLVGRYG